MQIQSIFAGDGTPPDGFLYQLKRCALDEQLVQRPTERSGRVVVSDVAHGTDLGGDAIHGKALVGGSRGIPDLRQEIERLVRLATPPVCALGMSIGQQSQNGGNTFQTGVVEPELPPVCEGHGHSCPAATSPRSWPRGGRPVQLQHRSSSVRQRHLHRRLAIPKQGDFDACAF